jgi:hypothetical protein
MKAKTLLVIAAALAAIVVIGCSNNSRTTAPANNETFTLPDNLSEGAIRFEPETAANVAQGSNPRIVTIQGKYLRDYTGCTCVETAWKEYTELTFRNGPPASIPNGASVVVRGEYVSVPGTRCGLEKHLLVVSIYAVTPVN